MAKPESLRIELFVADAIRALEFYCRTLGFVEVPKPVPEPDYRAARLGDVHVGFLDGRTINPAFDSGTAAPHRPPPTGVEIVIEVEDLDSAFARVKAHAPERIVEGPRKRPWGLTDFRLLDPEGYFLRITTRR